MRIPSSIQNFLPAKKSHSDPVENPELQQAWSISARLAAVSDAYAPIVPIDLADLIREAKTLHPEVAQGAVQRAQQD